jgi:hypothetical protein
MISVAMADSHPLMRDAVKRSRPEEFMTKSRFCHNRI